MPASPIRFDVASPDASTRARAGLLETPHGRVPTPAFMPVGTQATVKTLTPAQLEEIGADILLCNAFHLALRPGDEVVAKMGGLHRFTGWTRPILTDSGGYQVFSLAKLTRVTEEAVEFRSPLDGSPVVVSPERAVEIQERLGADLIMPLDEPVPNPCEAERARAAMERTHRWARRCLAARRRPDQALFGIVQGSLDPGLRKESAEAIAAMGFDGHAIGGLSVGETPAQMWEAIDATTPHLPADKPRYLMGVGTPRDLVEAVARGVDLFDCVLPTRLGRTGWGITSQGPIKLKQQAYREDASPLDPGCPCATCRRFSRAYLRHLFMAKEILGLTLITYHNVYFYIHWMRRIRESIQAGTFEKMLSDARAEPGLSVFTPAPRAETEV
jgi:queuine tRNA-ribosyltransferase